ncbi:MAG: hypothetical protein IMZ47_06785 [Firmicutes bacterium]|nr:hypothetical protein [Bacillota bacterium]
MPKGVYDHYKIKGRKYSNSAPREIRTCAAPDCSITFECTAADTKKYCCRGHHLIGKHPTKETIEKIKVSSGGKNSFRYGKTYEELFGEERAEEIKKKISVGVEGRKQSSEAKKKIGGALSKIHKGKSVRERGHKPDCNCGICKVNRNEFNYADEDRNRKIGEATRKRWKSPGYAKKVRHNIKPNKPEKLLNEFLKKLFPNEWQYVGNSQFSLAGKNPDFINVNGQKKIIEFNGDWWHGPEITGRTKEEEEQQRIDLFAQHGYQTLVIWECELKDETGLKIKLQEFCDVI